MRKFILFIFFISSQFSEEYEFLQNFPEILIRENEYLSNYPRSPYIFELNTDDFIVCKENPRFKNQNPKNINFMVRNQEFKNIGEFNNYMIDSFLKNKQIQSFISLFEEAYTKDPLFFAFLYNLGKLYQIEKNYIKSNYYFHKVLFYFPNYPRIHFHLGKNFYSLNNEIQGEYHLRKAIQLEKEQIEYWITFIDILLERNQISKAQLFLREGEKQFSNHPYFQLYKADFFLRKNKYANSLKELEKNQSR